MSSTRSDTQTSAGQDTAVATQAFSRRHFLALGGGAAVLAACGSKHPSTTAASGTGEKYTEIAPGIVSIDLYASPRPQRFAFAITAKEGYASGLPAHVALAPPGHTPSRFVTAVAHAQGLPSARGVYTVMATLDRPGFWHGTLEYDGAKAPFVFQVGAKNVSPIAGEPAPRAASPTTSQTLGVDPICTRVPACPLHTTSLDTLIGQGRPVAVLFATPARCMTQYCGPVLDTLLTLVPKYSTSIDFVHVEIYENNQTTDVISTVKAWGPLQGEPWLFGVDRNGVVSGRLDGAFGQTEMQSLLDGLARPV
jgi:hypothetical protein